MTKFTENAIGYGVGTGIVVTIIVSFVAFRFVSFRPSPLWFWEEEINLGVVRSTMKKLLCFLLGVGESASRKLYDFAQTFMWQ